MAYERDPPPQQRGRFSFLDKARGRGNSFGQGLGIRALVGDNVKRKGTKGQNIEEFRIIV